MPRPSGQLFEVFYTLAFLPRSPAQLSHLTETQWRCRIVWAEVPLTNIYLNQDSPLGAR